MKNLKVKVDKLHYGKKLNLPDIGKIDVSVDGIIEVPEKLANFLVQNLKYELVEEKETKGAKKEKVKEEVETDTFIDATTDKDEEIKIDLESLSVEELVEIAKGAGLPEEEWGSYKGKKKEKELLVKYLSTKL